MRRFVGLAVFLGSFVGIVGMTEAKAAPFGNAEVYDCTRTGGSRNLMSDRLLIIRDKTTGEIQVIDELIYTVHAKQPVPAKVKTDSATRLEISWTVDKIPMTNMVPGKALYRATFFKERLSYVEGVILAGYDNRENSHGTCKLMK